VKPSGAFPVIIVTGLSGSGKSTALRVLEDLRFFCVDGMPASMVPKLASLFEARDPSRYRGLALGMDVRQFDFVDDWDQAMDILSSHGVEPKVVFLEAEPDTLFRRYAETRRPHPLESGERGLDQALEEERRLLAPMREDADLIIDTSAYSIHDLRRLLQERYQKNGPSGGGLRLHLISFGFKYGPPREADLVFDLRFLPNPYFDPELRPLSGKDQPVADYVLEREAGREFVDKLMDFFKFVLPLYAEEGRYRLTIAMGCTGGRHRSVAITERIHAELQRIGFTATLEHRHLELG
jgi:UPF0042 nucleotide-binding protein